jgi:chromosome segregation ATPase
MTTDTKALVSYDITEAIITATREKCAALTADTPKGYEEVRIAIGNLRQTRTAIEKRRVELKADALTFGRLVDSEAKRFTTLLLEIEEPLKVKKAVIDDEAARIKAEAEAVKLRAIEAEIAANLARQEAERKAIRDAEEARIAAERKALEAERAALAEERRKADEAAAAARKAEDARLRIERDRLQKIEDAQRAEGEALRAELKRNREADEALARAEREKIEAERRKVAAEREKAERLEFERKAKIQAEADAKAKIEQDRIDALEREKRLSALLPDIEKVHDFAQAIRALSVTPPKVRSKRLAANLVAAAVALGSVADTLEALGVRVKAEAE